MFNYIPTSRLAASSVSPLKTAPDLEVTYYSKNKNWAQSVNYLRDFIQIFNYWGVHESESNDPYDQRKIDKIFKKTRAYAPRN